MALKPVKKPDTSRLESLGIPRWLIDAITQPDISDIAPSPAAPLVSLFKENAEYGVKGGARGARELLTKLFKEEAKSLPQKTFAEKYPRISAHVKPTSTYTVGNRSGAPKVNRILPSINEWIKQGMHGYIDYGLNPLGETAKYSNPDWLAGAAIEQQLNRAGRGVDSIFKSMADTAKPKQAKEVYDSLVNWGIDPAAVASHKK